MHNFLWGKKTNIYINIKRYEFNNAREVIT